MEPVCVVYYEYIINNKMITNLLATYCIEVVSSVSAVAWKIRRFTYRRPRKKIVQKPIDTKRIHGQRTVYRIPRPIRYTVEFFVSSL